MLSQVAPLPAPGATGPFKVVLINPYELGRQPFALAEPAAWLKREGFAVTCLDLSLQKIDPEILEDASLVALYVGMHTATRIAVEALPRIKQLAPKAHVCVYGLYAPMNEALLRKLGVGTVLGGELEPALVSLCLRLRAGGNGAGTAMTQSEPLISLGRIRFEVPDRSGLPKLSRYAHLVLPDGSTRVVGFAEGSRGCKHLCRHCPVVPVYQGKFRIVPVDVVIEDIRQQVKEGATHISFGDPDFFNGPTHGLRLARALNEAFPHVTFDATIKIQHLIDHAELLPELRRSGCLFVTSAVEAVDDDILRLLAKNHTSRDFDRAVALTREAGIALAPTFVAFTPWTTLDGYIALLERLLELQLVASVPPVQLTIRLLVPEGSYLLQLPGFKEKLMAFDAKVLGYPWSHADPRVDHLQQDLQAEVARFEHEGLPRREVFAAIWRMAHEAAGRPAPNLAGNLGAPIPRLSEPWYCCAEPTDQQLQSFCTSRSMKRVLLLLPTTGYRNDDFLAAAKKLGVEIVAAADYCHQLAPSWGLAPIMALHFDRPEQAADTVLREINGNLDAVLAVDDSGVELAALLAERLGLPGNPAHAVRRVRDKLAFRRLLQEQEFLCPEFHHLPTGKDPLKLVPELKFPVVVKARRLSGSRGVIRADDSAALVRAVSWVRAIQSRADRDAQELGLIIEDFIPGREYALEGSLQRGELTTLALFDKPDPLDGPYFEETLYITPSRLPEALQDRIHQEVARACRCAALTDGPVHAEVRINDQGVWILEVAARSIGGLCGRVLTHSLGMSLEELILRQVVAEPLRISGEGGAAGVMMIPIPRRGIYHGLEGLSAAQSVPGITGVSITAEPGQIIAPPPDGASYLGFIFARAARPAEAETALRSAHRRLHFDIRPEYPATQAPAAERT